MHDTTDALTRKLGPLPAAVAALDAADRQALLALLATAETRQADELDAAFEAALGHLPRLLRGTVRKMIRP